MNSNNSVTNVNGNIIFFFIEGCLCVKQDVTEFMSP